MRLVNFLDRFIAREIGEAEVILAFHFTKIVLGAAIGLCLYPVIRFLYYAKMGYRVIGSISDWTWL